MQFWLLISLSIKPINEQLYVILTFAHYKGKGYMVLIILATIFSAEHTY